MADRSLGLPRNPARRETDDQELRIAPVADRMGRFWRTLTATGARFWRAEDGNILIMGALLLPILIGMAALVLEYGGGLLARATNQRNADIAAYAGAVQYSATKSEEAMRASALQAARLNGLKPAQVTVTLVPSPRGQGNAVRVRITEQHSIVLGTILGANPLLDIVVEAYATIGEQSAAACILALNASSTGITLSGGTNLTAPKCSVSSNASLTVACGPVLKADTVNYNTNTPTQGCGGIQDGSGGPGKIVKAETPDPLSGNANVKAASDRLATVAALPALAAPTAPAAQNFDFGWSTANLATQAAAIGCTVNSGPPNFVVTCNAATVNIGSLTVTGGVTVDFDLAAPGTRNYNFNGVISVAAGSALRLPRGNFSVAKGISIQSSTASFGAGNFMVGALADACRYGDAERYSICVNGGSTATFGGPSSFTATAGIYTGDSATLKMGDGTTNSFDIGASTGSAARNSLYVGGGGTATLADALLDDKSFRMRGRVIGAGGSCVILGASANHDIGGYVAVDGSMIMGAGIYTIDGSFHLRAGGAQPCGGASKVLRAINVSIVLSGKEAASNNDCADTVFCIAGGQDNVEIVAPTTGPTADLAVIGPQNGSVKAAKLVAGAVSTKISGAFYFPTGPLIMGGGAGVNNVGAPACLQMIAAKIDLSAGATIATDCNGKGVGGKKRKVVFVQ